jgi:hypothetical protein
MSWVAILLEYPYSTSWNALHWAVSWSVRDVIVLPQAFSIADIFYAMPVIVTDACFYSVVSRLFACSARRSTSVSYFWAARRY